MLLVMVPDTLELKLPDPPGGADCVIVNVKGTLNVALPVPVTVNVPRLAKVGVVAAAATNPPNVTVSVPLMQVVVLQPTAPPKVPDVL